MAVVQEFEAGLLKEVQYLRPRNNQPNGFIENRGSMSRIKTHTQKNRCLEGLSGIFCLVFILLFTAPAVGDVKSVNLTMDLPARVWKAVRLKNLPKMSALRVSIAGDGEVTVFLVDSENYDSFPDFKRPLFEGEVRGRLSFAVKIPVSGNYFLIFRNSSLVNEARMDIKIQAANVSAAHLLQDGADYSKKQELIQETLSRITIELKKILVFKSFLIKAEACGKESAFSSDDSVVLCLEFARKVYSALEDKEKTSYVLFFAVLHEAAHIVLKQWGFPFYDNEDIADDFATMLFIMTNQRKHLTDVMEYFLSNQASTELMIKAVKGDRHQLSIQRARNIQEWAKDTERFARWMNLLIPHMQTPVLKKLLDTKTSLIDANKIEQELAVREK